MPAVCVASWLAPFNKSTEQCPDSSVCSLHGSSYPPVFGADNQQAALSEGAEGNALTALAVDWLRLLFKHWVQILHTQTHTESKKIH